MIVKPVKALLKSTMVYEVVTEGRKFAVKMSTGELTIIDLNRKEKIEVSNKDSEIKIYDNLYARFNSFDSKDQKHLTWYSSEWIHIREFQDVVNYINCFAYTTDTLKHDSFKIEFVLVIKDKQKLYFNIPTKSWKSYDLKTDNKKALALINQLSKDFHYNLSSIKNFK